MGRNGKKAPPHIRARQYLLSRIAELSAKGINRLPPQRELCAEFGVSLNTVHKAVNQLVMEGRLVGVPRKGHFIRTVAAETNIGIVMGGRSVSTFVREPDLLGDILNILSRRKCFVRLIQLPKPQDASQVFNQYKIDGCIWYLPTSALFPKISKVMANCKIPIVVPIMSYSPANAASLPGNHFTNDFIAVGRVRAEYLIRRGHRKIVYCAGLNTGTYEGFVEALRNVGAVHDPDWNISRIDEIPERLPGILDAGEVTAIISDGGRERLEPVFKILDGHPWSGKGELLVDFIGEFLSDLRKLYPRVNVTAVNYYPHHEIGKCADALVDAVKDGRPIQSVKFASQVGAPDWRPYHS